MPIGKWGPQLEETRSSILERQCCGREKNGKILGKEENREDNELTEVQLS